MKRAPGRLLSFVFDLQPPGYEGSGVVVAACRMDPASPWLGAQVFQSPKPSSGFRAIGTLAAEATIGRVVRTLTNELRFEGEPDDVTIEVLLPERFDLESVDDASIAAGRNLFVVGAEVISVQRWTFLQREWGWARYEGRGILRALAGTSGASRSHDRDEAIIALDYGGIEFVQLFAPFVSAPRFWRIVPAGGSIDTAGVIETIDRTPLCLRDRFSVVLRRLRWWILSRAFG